MASARDVLDTVREMVYRETIFLRHYVGQVADNQDPVGKGRVKVTVPSLGWLTADEGSWCRPRAGDSLKVPDVGAWVEVYFMEGERSQPVYLPGASEMQGEVPAAFSGTDSKVVFQDRKTGAAFVYDEAQKLFKLGGASESFVKGDTLYTFLQSLMTWIAAHVHTGVTTGAGSSGTAAGAPSLPDVRSTAFKGE